MLFVYVAVAQAIVLSISSFTVHVPAGTKAAANKSLPSTKTHITSKSKDIYPLAASLTKSYSEALFISTIISFQSLDKPNVGLEEDILYVAVNVVVFGAAFVDALDGLYTIFFKSNLYDFPRDVTVPSSIFALIT